MHAGPQKHACKRWGRALAGANSPEGAQPFGGCPADIPELGQGSMALQAGNPAAQWSRPRQPRPLAAVVSVCHAAVHQVFTQARHHVLPLMIGLLYQVSSLNIQETESSWLSEQTMFCFPQDYHAIYQLTACPMQPCIASTVLPCKHKLIWNCDYDRQAWLALLWADLKQVNGYQVSLAVQTICT